MTLIDALIRAVLTPLVIGLVFFVPATVVMVILLRRKKAYRQEANEPFIQLPLRPPGESLRVRIEELADKLSEEALGLAAAPAIAAIVTITAQPRLQFFIGGVMVVLVTGSSIYFGRRMFLVARKLWNYRLGFTGERVVGEELNQLLASGFRVFHDVPFDDYNIDHVLVGPPGLYSVETKSRRKPADINGPERASVTFDGEKLHFPRGKWDQRGVEQARRNARSLEAWLTKACGERVVAQAILTLPGWFVTRKAVSDVNVLNPDEIKRSFPNKPRHPLSPEQIQRIAHQLTERCRLLPT